MAAGADFYLGLHKRVEAAEKTNQETRAKLAESDHVLATTRIKQSSTASILWQRLKSSRLGHDALNDIAEHLRAIQPAAAASFLRHVQHRAPDWA